MKTLEVGEILSCPDCGTEIAECVEPLRSGEVIKASKFRAIEPHRIQAGTKMVCPMCASPFCKRERIGSPFMIHTKAHGWV